MSGATSFQPCVTRHYTGGFFWYLWQHSVFVLTLLAVVGDDWWNAIQTSSNFECNEGDPDSPCGCTESLGRKRARSYNKNE